MKKLILKSKTDFPFISKFGSVHENAVIVVSAINNNIIKKTLNLVFLVFNDNESLDKQELDFAFELDFNNTDVVETTVNEETKEVIWGKPSYDTVMKMFDITEDGLYLKEPQTEQWFLNKVEYQGKPLIEEWEILINKQ